MRYIVQVQCENRAVVTEALPRGTHRQFEAVVHADSEADALRGALDTPLVRGDPCPCGGSPEALRLTRRGDELLWNGGRAVTR